MGIPARPEAATTGGGDGGSPASTCGALPNLLVIGAQKCGTSALHSYLDLHPEIAMSNPKELDFFIEEGNWHRGVSWYRSHFDPRASVRGEASPNYTAEPAFTGAAGRVHRTVPDARLIYLVRDPIARIAAHWIQSYAESRTDETLASIAQGPYAATYVGRSRYHMQLDRYLTHYPLERILVLDQEDLRMRRQETMRGVFEFTGVDPAFTHPRFGDEHHQTGRKARRTRLGKRLETQLAPGRRPRAARAWAMVSDRPPFGRPVASPDVRAELPGRVLDELRADAENLRELTGRRFEHWSI